MPNWTKVNGKPSLTPATPLAVSAFPLDKLPKTLILMGNNPLPRKRV